MRRAKCTQRCACTSRRSMANWAAGARTPFLPFPQREGHLHRRGGMYVGASTVAGYVSSRVRNTSIVVRTHPCRYKFVRTKFFSKGRAYAHCWASCRRWWASRRTQTSLTRPRRRASRLVCPHVHACAVVVQQPQAQTFHPAPSAAELPSLAAATA